MTAPIQLENERMLRSALWYAKIGLHVFPLYEPSAPGVCSCSKGPACGNVGKHPRTPKGLLNATTDPEQITEWWRRWPRANVAIATGPSGLVVVDIDPRNGGDENLAELESRYGELPETPTAITGSCGQHYLFKRPPTETHLKSMTIRLGVDVKADGGYIVAAPSLHTSGQTYAWDAGRRLEDVAPALLPEWITRMISVEDRAPATASGSVADGFLGAAFEAAGWLGRSLDATKAAAQCPWEDEHTSGTRYDSSTVVFAPIEGKRVGKFHCSHAHCQNRTLDDVLRALPDDAKRAARARLKLDPDYEPRDSTPTPPTVTDQPAPWQVALRHNDKGQLTRDIGNLVVLLTNLEEWSGTLEYDEFADAAYWARPVPPMPGLAAPQPGDPLADHHYAYVHHWFAKYRGVAFAKDSVRDAMVAASRHRTRHPLRDYLEALTWDGTRRIPTWLSRYLGTDDTDYTRTVGQKWLVSAVARVLRPGCQADHLLVLEGSQGRGKSSAVRILGGEHYLGALPDIRTKDAAQALQGKWIVEIGELDAFKGAAGTRVKDWITQTEDHYRPAYGRFTVTRRRQQVFIGTTNEDHYLSDHTGARRFWPVQCARSVDLDALRADRDQLWAEAVEAYHSGLPWWPEPGELEDIQEAQEERQVVDAWEDRVLAWAAVHDAFSVADVLEGALDLKPEKWDRGAQTRVGAILARAGLRTHRVSRAGRRVRLYKCSELPAEVGQGESE